MSRKRNDVGMFVADGDPNARARARDQPAAVWLRPDELVPWEKNPRLNADVVAKVAGSIERFGFSSPIVARAEDHRIIAGHTRWKAALQLGLELVPVRLMDLPARDAELLALADNRLNELALWDTPELQRILAEYDLAEVELAGWTSEDLTKMANDLLAADGGFPELPGEPPYVQITFTLSHRQKELVDAALARAKKAGAASTDNENSNGNALAHVCEAFGG